MVVYGRGGSGGPFEGDGPVEGDPLNATEQYLIALCDFVRRTGRRTVEFYDDIARPMGLSYDGAIQTVQDLMDNGWIERDEVRPTITLTDRGMRRCAEPRGPF